MDSVMLNVSVADIFEGVASLEMILSEKRKMHLSLPLSRSLREFRSEKKVLDEKMEEITDEYALLDENNNRVPGSPNPNTGNITWKVDPPRVDAYTKEIRELMESKLDVKAYIVDITDFPKNTEIQGVLLESLMRIGIITEREENKSSDEE